MKSVKIILLFLLTWCIFPLHSQWIPCQGIEGASTNNIILHDTTLFITCTGNGVFSRNIHQNYWNPVCITGSYFKVRSTGQSVFCYGPFGFYRSVNSGESWDQIENVDDVFDIETIDSMIFIADNGIVERSDDQGVTWITIHPAGTTSEMFNLFAQEGIIFCSDISFDTIYISYNYGNNWYSMTTEGLGEFVKDVYLYSQDFYAASEDGVFLYHYFQAVWLPVEDSVINNASAFHFFDFNDNLYCCTSLGLFYFDEMNSSWIDDSDGIEGLYIYSGYPKGDTIFIATSLGPYYRIGSTDWVADYNDLFQLNVDQVFKYNSKIYALTRGKIYFSGEITTGFIPLESQTECYLNKIFTTDTAWYAGTSCGFAISTDTGFTWQEHSDGLESRNVEDISFTDNYYFASVEGGLFRSCRYPVYWERVPNSMGVSNVERIYALNNILFASLGANPGLYRSNDEGMTFNLVPEGGAFSPPLFIKDSLVFIVESNEYNVLRSDDLGETWHDWIIIPADVIAYCMDLSDSYDETVLGGCSYIPHGFYVYLFTPEHPEGINIRDNLPSKFNPWIFNILLDGGRIFICPNNYGLWYRDDLMVGVTDNDAGKPFASAGLSVYPNPARNILRIHPEKQIQHGEYQVIDYSGKLMAKGLVDNELNEFNVDVSTLLPGLYLIIINDDHGFCASGKFLKIN